MMSGWKTLNKSPPANTVNINQVQFKLIKNNIVILSASLLRRTFLEVWRQNCLHYFVFADAGSCRDPGMLPYLPSPGRLSTRWVLSDQSAVTLTGPLHHTERLCKHRATAAKHRCWQTVNNPHEQCVAFKATLNCLLVLSLCSPRPQRNRVEWQLGKYETIHNSICFPSRMMADRGSISTA